MKLRTEVKDLRQELRELAELFATQMMKMTEEIMLLMERLLNSILLTNREIMQTFQSLSI